MGEDLLVDIVKGIAQDVREVKDTVGQLRVDHKEVATNLKGHIKEYESDKLRYNSNIEYTRTIHKVVETKFDGIFKKVESRVGDTEIKLINLEDKIKSIKYWDNMCRILYTAGGTVLGCLSAFIVWVIKYGNMVK